MSSKVHAILVVEDDVPTREHFVEAIEGSPRLQLHGAVGTCADARRVLAERAPDVLLTDLGLPDGHGIELIREVRCEHPGVQILVISVFGDERTVIASVEAGANGYLLKDGTIEQLATSLLDLIEGGSPMSPPIARYILKLVQARVADAGSGRDRASKADAKSPSLSKREIEVLELLAKGFSAAEIAELLQLSPHTIIAHCRSIHRKLDVRSRSSAIFEAAQLGLIRLHD